MLNKVKWKRIHFAWDRPKDKLGEKFEMLHKYLKDCNRHKVSCYCLTNYDSTHEEDMMRVMKLKDCDIQPYVMVYRKETAPQITRRLQRYVNWPAFFWGYSTFDDFQAHEYKRPLETMKQITMFD